MNARSSTSSKFMEPLLVSDVEAVPQKRSSSRPYGIAFKALITIPLILLAILSFLVLRHQYGVRTSIPATSIGPCERVGRSFIENLKSALDPTVQTFFDGNPVPEGIVLPQNAEVCIIIAVPQRPLAQYRQIQIPNMGPDSIHMFLNSTSVAITMSPPRIFSEGRDRKQEVFTYGAVLYEKEMAMLHPGTYEIHADIEFSNWEWAQQWSLNNTIMEIIYPSGIRDEINGFIEWAYKTSREPRQEPIVIEKKHTSPSVLRIGRGMNKHKPPCTDHITASEGRWVSSQGFDVPGGLVDEWGYSWDGDHCRMHYFTDVETVSCLANRTIHVYGDSNSRRLVKSIVSGGHYCHNLTHLCQKDDAFDPLTKIVDQDGILEDVVDDSLFDWKNPTEKMLSIEFGQASKMYLGFLRMITDNWMDWVQKFYPQKYWSKEMRNRTEPPRESLETFQPGHDLIDGAVARSPPDAAKADLVLLAFGVWDYVRLPWMDDYAKVLPYFRDAVLEAYPDSVIILRMAHQICCQKTQRKTDRFNLARIQHMNDIVREVFRVNGATAWDGRILVTSPEEFPGMPHEVQDYNDYFSIHMRYSRIRTEHQMLLNSICKRSDDGDVQWRWASQG